MVVLRDGKTIFIWWTIDGSPTVHAMTEATLPHLPLALKLESEPFLEPEPESMPLSGDSRSSMTFDIFSPLTSQYSTPPKQTFGVYNFSTMFSTLKVG
ncbi:hypothetical protein J1N35_023414 [Gossypium stocksii]|uniref:Uncharacterized protein n=1 Tax=Gossypium stocksii TaxID=47602 RepID=A0A9D3VIE8_9ROSI|nr:hypothetical protein J1N35_023414 [Gossypium stocksii]